MSNRTSFATRSSAGRRHSPAPSSIAPSSVSPRSNTPTRFNPTHHKRQPQHQMPPANPVKDNRSGSSTPNGRHRNTGRKRGDSRKPHQPQSPETPVGSEPETPDVDTEEDSEELFQILGVNGEDNGEVASSTPAMEKGLLRLSKENMDAALGNNGGKKKRTRTKNKPRNDTPVDQKADAVSSDTRVNGVLEGSPASGNNTPARRKRGKGGNKQDASPSREPSPNTLDMSAMSRSLPASFFADEALKPKTSDASKGWDMPTDSPTGTSQPLNWQQQLQAEESASPVRRGSRSNASENRRRSKASPTAVRNHDRHQSLDQVPVSNLTKMIVASGPASAGARPPASAFDSSIPFHTGFNVHRAPQTPVRNPATRGAPIGGAMSLPIVGDFPRINKSGAPLGGPKYAGPTFHNSPASGSLPKPDLDDF